MASKRKICQIQPASLEDCQWRIRNWRIADLLDGKWPKLIPTLYWTSEIYSFGRCYRKMLGTRLLPALPFYSDHGVHAKNLPAKHEIANDAEFHVLWSKEREAGFKEYSRLTIRVCHPYVFYHKVVYKKSKVKKRGTLVFYAHSTPDATYIESQPLNNYVESLKESGCPPPYTVCLHMWDVLKGGLPRVNRHDVIFVTAGNTMSPYFVDRLFHIIESCEVSVSNVMGSHSFISELLGTPFRLYGKEPSLENLTDKNIPLGIYNVYEDENISEEFLKARQLFMLPHSESKSEKMECVSKVLGCDRLDFVIKGGFRVTFKQKVRSALKLIYSRSR